MVRRFGLAIAFVLSCTPEHAGESEIPEQPVVATCADAAAAATRVAERRPALVNMRDEHREAWRRHVQDDVASQCLDDQWPDEQRDCLVAAAAAAVSTMDDLDRCIGESPGDGIASVEPAARSIERAAELRDGIGIASTTIDVMIPDEPVILHRVHDGLGLSDVELVDGRRGWVDEAVLGDARAVGTFVYGVTAHPSSKKSTADLRKFERARLAVLIEEVEVTWLTGSHGKAWKISVGDERGYLERRHITRAPHDIVAALTLARARAHRDAGRKRLLVETHARAERVEWSRIMRTYVKEFDLDVLFTGPDPLAMSGHVIIAADEATRKAAKDTVERYLRGRLPIHDDFPRVVQSRYVDSMDPGRWLVVVGVADRPEVADYVVGHLTRRGYDALAVETRAPYVEPLLVTVIGRTTVKDHSSFALDHWLVETECWSVETCSHISESRQVAHPDERG